jgi:hypothetical protein
MPERAPQPEREPDAAAQAEPAARPSPQAPDPHGILALQRGAGNAAVAALLGGSRVPKLARFELLPGEAVVHRTKAQIDAMTLSAFNDYAEQQADWAMEPGRPPATPKMTPDEIAKLRQLLEFAREEDGGKQPILAGCGDMRVTALLAVVGDVATRELLRRYGRAVARVGVAVKLKPVAFVDRALDYARALEKLEVDPGPGVSATIFKQTGTDQLGTLMDLGFLDDFINYCQTCQPLLEASNGSEINSYISLRLTEATDPVGFLADLPEIRNYHRFEKAALTRLVANRKYFKQDKPLVLILHSAFDHNGAFHRDPFLTAVITDDRKLTLMVEGKESLADVASEIGPLAATYGKGGKIHQVMIAGHGNAKSMQLAGTLDESILDAGGTGTSAERNERLSSIPGAAATAETDKLMAELLKNMSSDPSARIVLNACLTASNTVNKPLSADPDDAADEVIGAIAAEPSLATYLGQAAANAKNPLQVRGANASFGQVKLMDAAGNLDIKPEGSPDPMMTASKLEYVRGGNEPQGCLRAVLEVWAQDRASLFGGSSALDAIKARLKEPDSLVWDQRVIRTLYAIVLANPDDAELIRVLQAPAGDISELKFEEECRVAHLASVPDAQMATIFTGLTTASLWGVPRMPLVILQKWLTKDNSKRAAFLAKLAEFNCESAQPFVDLGVLGPHLPALLDLGHAAAPAKGELILALLGVEQDPENPEPRSKAFLRAVVGANPGFPPGLGIDALLGGLSNTAAVEKAIGVRDPDPLDPDAGKDKKKPNVDLDGDGVNDFYVQPITRHGFTTASLLNVRKKPGKGEAVVEQVPRDTHLEAIGKSDDWLAIEYKGRTRFVHKDYVTLEIEV